MINKEKALEEVERYCNAVGFEPKIVAPGLTDLLEKYVDMEVAEYRTAIKLLIKLLESEQVIKDIDKCHSVLAKVIDIEKERIKDEENNE